MISHRAADTPTEELDTDRRREKRLFWKGVLSAVAVAVVVIVRQRYLV